MSKAKATAKAGSETTVGGDFQERLAQITLLKGGHKTREEGMCFNEAAAWLKGEPHSDKPQCVCKAVNAATMKLNDRMDDATRNELLKPLLVRAIGSAASHAVYVKRGFVAADYAVRHIYPIYLEVAGKLDLAAKLRALAPLVDRETSVKAAEVVRAIFPYRWYFGADADAAADAAAADAADAAAADAAAADAAADADAKFKRFSDEWWAARDKVYKEKYEEYRLKFDASGTRRKLWLKSIEMVEAMLAVTDDEKTAA